MSSGTNQTTVQSDAELRVITVKTEAGDIVKFSGNPAELPGARYETTKALRRAGAFTLLVEHNASRLKNGTIAVDNVNNIPFVTGLLDDPDQASYTFEKPCPDTSSRITKLNAQRTANGEPQYTGADNIAGIPDKLLKLAVPNKHEVATEALAYALTQLSIFEDVQHANELLVACDYDGRKLAPLLDQIESQASLEDITLVTGRRNAFKEAGLRGLPLTFDSFRAFNKAFDVLEYRCPPNSRLSDNDRSQLVGTLFIKDPAARKNWSDHINQPEIINANGIRVSGPPRTYVEAKLLAEKVLRSVKVLSGIDELSSPSSVSLAAGSMAALMSDSSSSASSSSGVSAQQIFEALVTDPRKSFAGDANSARSSVTPFVPIDVPRGDDGKYLYWAPPMKPCDCGTPDEGRHIRDKWPCANYRNPDKHASDPSGSKGKGKGKGKDKGKQGKGKSQSANYSEDQIAAAVTALQSAGTLPESPKTPAKPPSPAPSAPSVAGSDTQSGCVTSHAELEALLNSSTLGDDLKSFFESPSKALPKAVEPEINGFDFLVPDLPRFLPYRATGLILKPEHSKASYLKEAAKSILLNQGSDRFGLLRSLSERAHSFSSDLLTSADEQCEPSCQSCVIAKPSPSQFNTIDSNGCCTGCTNACPTAWRSHPDARTLCGSSIDARPGYRPQFAFLSGVTLGTPSVDQIQKQIDANSLPIFRAPIDSGCTATCTNTLAHLVNTRKCNEVFDSANGEKCNCDTIGDMPVLAKDSAGNIFRFVFTNVRYVPGFKYTLISVKQSKREQGIKPSFDDPEVLTFPNGSSVPFDPRFRLYTVTLISEPMLINGLAAIEKSKTSGEAGNSCCVGFHNVKSTSHIARLPAAQASELIHRRCHMGVNKIRALPHVSSDAPKILGSAIPCTCVHCAASQIRRAGHSGAMDTPDPEPGILHIDLKGPFPLSVTGKYRYAAFVIDEYSRFVFVEFLRDKSEVIEATKRVIAKFNALVGTPVDEKGVAVSRPKIRRLHRDHEGGLESRQFEAFRAHELLYSTTSAPHDHDLNPIAESTINVISTLATSYKSLSNAPVGFWPELLRYAVDWHNSVPQGAIGSSTSDSQISPHQRFTLKLPKVMDLAAIGSRTVVLKPPTHQSKTTLASRGWVGIFLGRSSDAVGTWEVWVPSINRKVRSSSLTIDEEFFPWHGEHAHQPLTSSTMSARFLSDHLGPTEQLDGPPAPTEFVKPSDINETPRASLSFLNLFSGPYRAHRDGGLSKTLQAFGWDSVTDFDNDRELGGGWQDDLLNDARYTELLHQARAGAYDAIHCAYPCVTTTVARCFDASGYGGGRGPIPVRDAEHPDGIPDLPPKYRRELLNANRLLDRTVEILIAAHHSPRRTTICFEGPADRSIPGTAQHMADVSHGSVFATSQFKRLQAAVPKSSMATFANCRFDSTSQKYMTIWYTNDAAPVLDKLNESAYQCNHPPGTHQAVAGGRDDYGFWLSTDTAHYMPGLCTKIGMALTFARTGDPTPLSRRRQTQKPADDLTGATNRAAPPVAPSTTAEAITEISRPAHVDPSATPRRISFSSTPAGAPTRMPPSPIRSLNLGPGIASSPQLHPRQDMSTREVRTSVREAREARMRPETIIESEEENDAPYTTFSGSPTSSWGHVLDGADSADMEATVASIVYDSHADDIVPGASNLTDWFDFSGRVPDDAVRTAGGKFVFDATADQIKSVIDRGGINDKTHATLIAVQSGLNDSIAQYGLRADSAGAPETYGEAMSRGAPWPAAIDKEFGNHSSNDSWHLINKSAVPRGRRVHKFVWVFKEKRDGTAKARLCVQGCTLEEGVDYDQTFAKPLRHASARGLFAYAARNRCNVRSVDFVAAYLQGEFIEGEVVYCKQPPGSNQIGSDGQPMVCVITKPIYGIPQAGRRLQRKIFPWCTDVMKLRQLDDSDDCVFVYDDPSSNEIFSVGIYVDNMQIVHSAELDDNGAAIDDNSFYARFMSRLRDDWDVIDEGPMTDLLGIDCDKQPDGSILLHQDKYIRTMLSRFAPDGPVHKRCSVPYSADLPRLVIEAFEGSSADAPSHPELIKPYQTRVGALMYACTGTRPDLAYAVHQHCRVLSRPTPELMAELDYVFSYLSENQGIGIRFTPEDGVLRGTADASWEVRASTSGWIVYWHGAPLCWGSRKQKSIALSSCESEIVALSEAAKEVIYLRKFVRGLVPSLPEGPTVLSTDNKAARDLSYNPEHHDRSKHIARRHFFIRDMVEAQEIVVPLVSTEDNDADFFTKPLSPKRFKMLRRKVMNLR